MEERDLTNTPRAVRISPKGIAVVEFMRDDAPALGLNDEDKAWIVGCDLAKEFDGTKTMRQLYLESRHSDHLLDESEIIL